MAQSYRAYKSYTTQETDSLFAGFSAGEPLSDLEARLTGRSASSIIYRLEQLTTTNPDIWVPEKVERYVVEYREQTKDKRAEYKKRYRATPKGIESRRRENKKYVEAHKEEIREYMRDYAKRIQRKWEHFGNYLGGLVVRYYDTQKEAAAEFGIHSDHLSNILAGNIKPTDDFLQRVSEKIGVSYKNLETKLEQKPHHRVGAVYSPQELDALLNAINSGASPTEVLALLPERTGGGLAHKLYELSEEEPELWVPEKVAPYKSALRRDYTREYQQREERREERKKALPLVIDLSHRPGVRFPNLAWLLEQI